MTYHPCPETFDIGPFRFECAGHIVKQDELWKLAKRGKVGHYSTSPGDVGDCDVTWWTHLTEHQPEVEQ